MKVSDTVSGYRICNRCVMDTSASDVLFDEQGVCNYCTDFLEGFSLALSKSADDTASRISALVENVKASGTGRAYDCVVGVSGGVDSSWTLYSVVQLGLRPLAVHMDNGWDSELAQQNIENLVRRLNVDLYTYVIDWEEYRSLQQAFFDADVVDIELLYDNALLGVVYREAARHRVKFILAGTNEATEGMRMPPGWNWRFKYDKKNVYSVWKHFGNGQAIRSFPGFGTMDYVYFAGIRNIRWISFLDYVAYDKASAVATLQRELGYRPYPYKHYESVFTRFYQGYLLPRKFGIDKRRLHLSNLVVTGQMNRDDAMRLLEQNPYPSYEQLEGDLNYFLKKMGWDRDRLNGYLGRPGRCHAEYGTEERLWGIITKVADWPSIRSVGKFVGRRRL